MTNPPATGKFNTHEELVEAVVNSMKTHKEAAKEFGVKVHVVATIMTEEQIRSKLMERRR
jgi:hypothetical protein